MTRTSSDPDIDSSLRLRALARWENEGGRVLLRKMRERSQAQKVETSEDSRAPQHERPDRGGSRVE